MYRHLSGGAGTGNLIHDGGADGGFQSWASRAPGSAVHVLTGKHQVIARNHVVETALGNDFVRTAWRSTCQVAQLSVMKKGLKQRCNGAGEQTV
jgi:hypothetical protein